MDVHTAQVHQPPVVHVLLVSNRIMAQEGDVPTRGVLGPLYRAGVVVIVGGRLSNPGEGTGKFLTLDDLLVPAELKPMFVGLSEAECRVDISSTEIRREQAKRDNQERPRSSKL